MFEFKRVFVRNNRDSWNEDTFPVPDPVKIVASIIFFVNLVTLNRVPLPSLGGLKFLKRIIGVLTFNLIILSGNPGVFNEFRNQQDSL